LKNSRKLSQSFASSSKFDYVKVLLPNELHVVKENPRGRCTNCPMDVIH